MQTSASSVAVLTSGGLDSAILVADLANRQIVYPIYIRAGAYWEATELVHLKQFLLALDRHTVQPLVVLDMPVGDLYGEHWSLSGRGVPDADSRDEAVFLPGRNLLLLAKALLWCHLHRLPALALATLKANPFPDATDTFFSHVEAAANVAMAGTVSIERPYAQLEKTEVLKRGEGLPLQWTFSCISPVKGRHCGRCNKCAERKRAFVEIGWHDPTEYAV